MDLTKMDSVVEVHDEDFYATVEPGVTRTALNNYIRDTGLCFPIGILSLVPRPSRSHANIIREIFYVHQKALFGAYNVCVRAGRSGNEARYTRF